MKCSRCGSELKNTDTICLNCGNIVEPSNHDAFEIEDLDVELENLIDSYKNDNGFVRDNFEDISIQDPDGGPDYSSFNSMNQNETYKKKEPEFEPISAEEVHSATNVSFEDGPKEENNNNDTDIIDVDDIDEFEEADTGKPVEDEEKVEEKKADLTIEDTTSFDPISMDDTGIFEPVEVDSTESEPEIEETVIEPVMTSNNYEEGIPEIVSSPKSTESEVYNNAYYEPKKEKKSFFAKRKEKKEEKAKEEEYKYEPVPEGVDVTVGTDDYTKDSYNSDVVFDDGETNGKTIMDIIPFKTIFIIAAVILFIILAVLVYKVVTNKPKSTTFDSDVTKETGEKSKYSLTTNPNYIKDKTWVCGGAKSDGSLGSDYSTYFQYDFYKNKTYATKSIQRDDDYEDGTYSVSLEEITDTGYVYKVTLVANLDGGYKTKYFFTLTTNKEGTKGTYKINGSTYACEEMDYFNNK